MTPTRLRHAVRRARGAGGRLRPDKLRARTFAHGQTLRTSLTPDAIESAVESTAWRVGHLRVRGRDDRPGTLRGDGQHQLRHRRLRSGSGPWGRASSGRAGWTACSEAR